MVMAPCVALLIKYWPLVDAKSSARATGVASNTKKTGTSHNYQLLLSLGLNVIGEAHTIVLPIWRCRMARAQVWDENRRNCTAMRLIRMVAHMYHRPSNLHKPNVILDIPSWHRAQPCVDSQAVRRPSCVMSVTINSLRAVRFRTQLDLALTTIQTRPEAYRTPTYQD